MEPMENLKKEKKQLKRLSQLREMVYTNVATPEVFVHESDEPILPSEKEKLEYKKIEKGHVWAGVFGCAWFHVVGNVPKSCVGKHVVLHIDVGGEGLVYDGVEPVKGITNVVTYLDKVSAPIGKSIVEISKCSSGNERVDLFFDCGYNSFFNKLIGKGKFRYAHIAIVNEEARDLYYDYLTFASLLSITENKVEREKLNVLLDCSFNFAIKGEISKAREVFSPLLNGKADETLKFTAVGHSHLDLAWLWPLRETKRKAERTFANQLYNLEEYDNYIYGASQPQQFEWIKNKCPKQYEALKRRIVEGKIEPQGGMWVESDTNVTSGESLIMQIFYGKKFFADEFGQDMRICWLPDVFGYNANLPQILKKSDIPYFLTIKLSWNEHNRFPHRSFKWVGIDGSEVLVHMPPDETYNSCGSPACAKNAKNNFSEKHLIDEAVILFGVGDGGGGPSEAHIEMISRQENLQGCPKITTGKAIDFFDRMNCKKQNLPTYNGELYLEKHQGTYTTQGRNKRFNRQSEFALQDLQALLALAYTRGFKYPQEQLDLWWKEILLYQFHDIIPGSSIQRVYDESRARYAVILEEIAKKKEEVIRFLCEDGDEKFVFNPTSFDREQVFGGNKASKVRVGAYAFAKVQSVDVDNKIGEIENGITNGILDVKFNKHGEIVSLRDKNGVEFAKEYLNRLKLFFDRPLHYNAWDIHWKYHNQKGKTLKAFKFETVVENGKIIRKNYYKHFKTTIIQEVSLTSKDDKVEIKTYCDFHEIFKMLRAEFEPTVKSDEVKCDIQFGSINRTTHDETAIEKAQFEICAHKYVDVSDDSKGFSLLNDCKYGHRVKNGLISLNLLRSPKYPDRKADIGEHVFTYALYPHADKCGVDTLKESYFLNKPLIEISAKNCPNFIARTTNESVVCETIKKAYDQNGIIVRLYEGDGKTAKTALQVGFEFEKAFEVNLIEKNNSPIDLNDLSFTPFEIKTILLMLK